MGLKLVLHKSWEAKVNVWIHSREEPLHIKSHDLKGVGITNFSNETKRIVQASKDNSTILGISTLGV